MMRNPSTPSLSFVDTSLDSSCKLGLIEGQGGIVVSFTLLAGVLFNFSNIFCDCVLVARDMIANSKRGILKKKKSVCSDMETDAGQAPANVVLDLNTEPRAATLGIWPSF